MDLPKQKGKEQTEHPEERQGASRRGVFIPELRATLRRLEKNVDTRAHLRTERQIETAANDEKEMRELLSQIAVVAFVGPSGTGKSYRAMDICRKYNIDGVIDDGLFIYKGMVIAGESAKRSGTKIGAIKAAIFNDEAKAKKVAHAIRSKRPDSILILGICTTVEIVIK